MPVLLLGNVCVLFDSRTNLGGGGGVCNDLWLQLMTVSLCDGLIRRMYVERERENSAHERGRAYFARPSRVSQLSLALGHVSLRVTTSHHLLISSVFVYVDRFILRCEYNYASRLRRVITDTGSVQCTKTICYRHHLLLRRGTPLQYHTVPVVGNTATNGTEVNHLVVPHIGPAIDPYSHPSAHPQLSDRLKLHRRGGIMSPHCQRSAVGDRSRPRFRSQNVGVQPLS